MPARYNVFLRTDRPELITSNGIHAVVTRWLDPAGQHHSPRKGLSTSPLTMSADGRARFEIGVVDDELCARLEDQVGASELRFGPVFVAANDLELVETATATWGEMQSSSEEEGWRFTFLSPTTFRSGKSYRPNPTPGLVFGHLRAVWAEFGTAVGHLDLAEAGLVEVERSISVERHPVLAGFAPGFVGHVSFRALTGCGDTRRSLNCLTRLASFSGIGARTAYGMGVVRTS